MFSQCTHLQLVYFIFSFVYSLGLIQEPPFKNFISRGADSQTTRIKAKREESRERRRQEGVHGDRVDKLKHKQRGREGERERGSEGVGELPKMSFLWICCVSIFGVVLSLYTLYVEYKAHTAEDDNPYVALCDISEKMSCSKVFLSEYGKIFSSLGVIPKDSVFDQPNAVYGILFYCIVLSIGGLAHFNKISISLAKDILLLCATLSVLLSAYLSYILAEVLQDICVVCFSTYVANFLLFYMCSANALSNDEAGDTKSIDKGVARNASETKLATKKKKN